MENRFDCDSRSYSRYSCIFECGRYTFLLVWINISFSMCFHIFCANNPVFDCYVMSNDTFYYNKSMHENVFKFSMNIPIVLL